MLKNTRVPVRTLFGYLEGNYTLDEFLECFPSVTREMAHNIGGCGRGSGDGGAVPGGGRQEVDEGLYPAAFADRKPPDEWAVWVFDEPS